MYNIIKNETNSLNERLIFIQNTTNGNLFFLSVDDLFLSKRNKNLAQVKITKQDLNVIMKEIEKSLLEEMEKYNNEIHSKYC